MTSYTPNQIREIYTAKSIEASTAQRLFMEAREQFGIEHATTQFMWNAYLAADEAAQPWRVRMGQISMQEQIDNGMEIED